MQEIDEVIDKYTGLSRTVLEYSRITKTIVDLAKLPGFSVENWGPLSDLVDTDAFERVGNFKEVMDWSQYIDFLTNWAGSSEWEGSFKRITETSGLVFLELEERSIVGDFTSIVNSVSVYEFNDSGKIRHIDVYLQMTFPEMGMLESYDGIKISE